MNSLYYLIPLSIILIFVMPIFFNLRISYNVFNNKGAVGVYLFNIKLTSFIFKLSNMSIMLYTDKKVSEEEIDFESKEAILAKNLMTEVKDKTKLKVLELSYNIGLNDAFLTAMITGYINLITLILFTRIKCTKPTSSLMLKDNISYNNKVFEVAARAKISISLFDVVYSFINSVILSTKQANKCN